MTTFSFQVSSAPTPTATQPTNSSTTTSYDSHNMPVINTQRMVNGSVTVNGHYQAAPTSTSINLIREKKK